MGWEQTRSAPTLVFPNARCFPALCSLCSTQGNTDGQICGAPSYLETHKRSFSTTNAWARGRAEIHVRCCDGSFHGLTVEGTYSYDFELFPVATRRSLETGGEMSKTSASPLTALLAQLYSVCSALFRVVVSICAVEGNSYLIDGSSYRRLGMLILVRMIVGLQATTDEEADLAGSPQPLLAMRVAT